MYLIMLSSNEISIQAYVRVIDDATSLEYPRCIEILGPSSILLVEPASMQTSAFEKKDKIKNSPNNPEPLPQPQTDSRRFSFVFTQIFSENEPISAISNALNLSTIHSHCIINVGKSDTLISRHGIIISSINTASKANYTVDFCLVSINYNKIASLTNGYQRITDFPSMIKQLYALDYFNPKKPRDEMNIMTMILCRNYEKIYLQFADVSQIGNSFEVLQSLLTNTYFARQGSRLAKEPLVHVLSKSICLGGKVSVIANIYPTLPFIIQTRSVLVFLNDVERNKDRSRGEYLNLMLKEIKKLQKNSLRSTSALNNEVKLLKEQLLTQGEQLTQVNLENDRLDREKSQYLVAKIANENNSIVNDLQNSLSAALAKYDKLQILFGQQQNELQELKKKDQRGQERLIQLEKENWEYIQNLRKLQGYADNTWETTSKMEKDLAQEKIRAQKLEEICEKKQKRIEVLEQEKLNKYSNNTEEEIPMATEIEAIHMEHYEQIVVLNRIILGLQDVYLEEKNEIRDKYAEMYESYKDTEIELTKRCKDLENQILVNSRRFEEQLRNVEKEKNIAKDESENLKKTNGNMHNFKNRIKEKAKAKVAEYSKKIEEFKEAIKKLLNEKNNLIEEINGLTSKASEDKMKFEKERQKLREEKEILLANIEKLKELREPHLRKGKS